MPSPVPGNGATRTGGTPIENQPEKNITRRKGSPWWLSISLAAASYYGLKYFVPGLLPESSNFYQLSQAAPAVAPIIAIVFLLLGAKQLYDTDSPKNNTQTDHKEKNHQESSDNK